MPPHSDRGMVTWRRRRGHVTTFVVACTAALLLAGCGGSAAAPTSGAPVAPEAPSETASVPEDPGNATSAPDVTASPGEVTVDWSGGRDVEGMDVGLPSPSGWYDAALGAPTDDRVLYLTFDDGPGVPYTEQLVDLLSANDARATFFMVGQVAAQHPEIVRRVAEAGNAVGNHSWSHADLISLPRREVRRELESTQEALLGVGGPCMRPPYGLIDDQVASVAGSLGLTPVMWTGQAGDWNRRPVSMLVERMKAATEPGAVLLLHDGGARDRTVAAVSELLPWWRDQGYRLLPLPPCVP